MERKITYTEAGKAELEKYLDERKRDLEQRVIEQKYIFGDDKIEITGGDIRYAADLKPQKILMPRRRPFVRYLLEIYFVFGLLLFMAGLFYTDLRYLINDIIYGNPVQALLMLSGAILVIASLCLRFIFVRINVRKERSLTNNSID